jgi:hypothetical protein
MGTEREKWNEDRAMFTLRREGMEEKLPGRNVVFGFPRSNDRTDRAGWGEVWKHQPRAT